MDFITAAQAFHWFEIGAFKKECKRILKPRGKVFLVWNTRDVKEEINVRQHEVFKSFCPDFKGFNGGVKEDDDMIYSFFDSDIEREEFDNPLYYDREKYIQRCLSSSYSLNESDVNYTAYLQAINDMFDKYSVDGVLAVPNKTEVYFNRI